MASPCFHFDQIHVRELPSEVEGCAECLRTGSRWVHLRQCPSCGEVGCCDGSPERHASRHAGSSGHPIIRSLEPGKEWCWCFEDEAAFVVRFA